MKYFKKVISIMLVVIVFVTLSFPSSADMGGYLQNTITQMQGLSPKSYQGQQRGYFVGGSMHLPSYNDNQPLVSFTRPSLRAGCGGIDLVMGGFSYLNFEYLVQKLQAILQTAPAFAFQLALKVLSEQVGDVLGSLDALTQMINSLNVDSCKASKALAGFAGQSLGLTVGDQVGDGSEDAWFTSLKTTITEVSNKYKGFIEKYSGYYDCLTAGVNADACMKSQGQVSFLTSLLDEAFSNTSTTIVNFKGAVRAKFGDVYQDGTKMSDDNIPPIQTDSGCEDMEGAPNLIYGLVYGEYKYKDTVSEGNDSTCRQHTIDEKAGIVHYIENILMQVRDNIKSGSTTLTQDQINLINASSIPIYKMLSLAVLIERIDGYDSENLLSDPMIVSFSTMLAYDIAFQVMAAKGASISKLIDKVMANKANLLDDSSLDLVANMKSGIKYELEQAVPMVKGVREALTQQLGDAYTRMKNMQEKVYQALARTKLLDSYLFAKGIR